MTDIKEIKSQIGQLNERVVEIEEGKMERLPPEKEVKEVVVEEEAAKRSATHTEEREKIPVAVAPGEVSCEAALNLLKEVLKFDDPRHTLELVSSLIAMAEGEELDEVIESVKSSVQETRVSTTPEEIAQKEVEMKAEESPAKTEEMTPPGRDIPETPVEAKDVNEGKPPETVWAPVKKAKETFSKTIDVVTSSRPRKVTFDEERLKKMVKPQLISLCKDLNIECDYMETKNKIITRILGH